MLRYSLGFFILVVALSGCGKDGGSQLEKVAPHPLPVVDAPVENEPKPKPTPKDEVSASPDQEKKPVAVTKPTPAIEPNPDPLVDPTQILTLPPAPRTPLNPVLAPVLVQGPAVVAPPAPRPIVILPAPQINNIHLPVHIEVPSSFTAEEKVAYQAKMHLLLKLPTISDKAFTLIKTDSEEKNTEYDFIRESDLRPVVLKSGWSDAQIQVHLEAQPKRVDFDVQIKEIHELDKNIEKKHRKDVNFAYATATTPSERLQIFKTISNLLEEEKIADRAFTTLEVGKDFAPMNFNKKVLISAKASEQEIRASLEAQPSRSDFLKTTETYQEITNCLLKHGGVAVSYYYSNHLPAAEHLKAVTQLCELAKTGIFRDKAVLKLEFTDIGDSKEMTLGQSLPVRIDKLNRIEKIISNIPSIEEWKKEKEDLNNLIKQIETQNKIEINIEGLLAATLEIAHDRLADIEKAFEDPATRENGIKKISFSIFSHDINKNGEVCLDKSASTNAVLEHLRKQKLK